MGMTLLKIYGNAENVAERVDTFFKLYHNKKKRLTVKQFALFMGYSDESSIFRLARKTEFKNEEERKACAAMKTGLNRLKELREKKQFDQLVIQDEKNEEEKSYKSIAFRTDVVSGKYEDVIKKLKEKKHITSNKELVEILLDEVYDNYYGVPEEEKKNVLKTLLEDLMFSLQNVILTCIDYKMIPRFKNFAEKGEGE